MVYRDVLSWLQSSNLQLQLSGALAIANFARNGNTLALSRLPAFKSDKSAVSNQLLSNFAALSIMRVCLADSNCVKMLELGVVPHILNLLERHVDQGDVSIQHAGLSALRNLAIPGTQPPQPRLLLFNFVIKLISLKSQLWQVLHWMKIAFVFCICILVSGCVWLNVSEFKKTLMHLGMLLSRPECDLVFQPPTKCGCWKTEWLKGSRRCFALTCHRSSSNSWGRYACWWMDKVMLRRQKCLSKLISRLGFCYNVDKTLDSFK